MNEFVGVQICGLPLLPPSPFCSLTDLHPFNTFLTSTLPLLFPFLFIFQDFSPFVQSFYSSPRPLYAGFCLTQGVFNLETRSVSLSWKCHSCTSAQTHTQSCTAAHTHIQLHSCSCLLLVEQLANPVAACPIPQPPLIYQLQNSL